MVVYCNIGEGAKLTVNGTAVGTYIAPLNISIATNPITPNYPSWMNAAQQAATTVLPPGVYNVGIQDLCYPSIFTNRQYSVRAIYVPPADNSYFCTGQNRSYYGSTDIIELCGGGRVSLYQEINSSVGTGTTFNRIGDNSCTTSFTLTAIDGNGVAQYSQNYTSRPAFSVECISCEEGTRWDEECGECVCSIICDGTIASIIRSIVL